jgi:hypothetical protein
MTDADVLELLAEPWAEMPDDEVVEGRPSGEEGYIRHVMTTFDCSREEALERIRELREMGRVQEAVADFGTDVIGWQNPPSDIMVS